MREILFRGKRINSREWAYGDLLTCDDEMEIYSESHGENGGWVIPETVGEYTGLTDKNGVKIFEGDIIKSTTSGTIGKVGYYPEEGAFMVLFNASSGYCVGYLDINMSTIEIIGNIYDNPELIKDDTE